MKYLILGIIQGLTEFLPVSSSGHLVVVQKIMNLHQDVLKMLVFSHLGTLVALIFYFFKDILRLIKSLRLILNICLVSFTTGIFAFCFRHHFESLFNLTWIVSLTLIINGIIIFISRFFVRSDRGIYSLGFKDSFGFGLIQAVAIIPGISRSGMTISYLMWRGLNREDAFRFSFLAGIPAIFGAFVLESNIKFINPIEFKNLFICFLASFFSGIFSLWILKNFLDKRIFYYFGYYCMVLGILSIFIV